ncbi:MAG: hypothetical protein A3F33_02990 [Candidatus Woykebacteria bacterium RIFCSPHIGHO2_12_FULL_43_10]|uniref:Adenylate kinase n=2 Tax=Candidatus Woykeibacteriota TaxID=1817899 RepID=A0A1G1WXM4_9BACT|nr:MAG: hypothetical protein A2802_01615 [Candidatus Woykebacteria bacterium RIFCSPHIGHO2_01_FULL_43_29]OGY28714.1 MAG: hypothetical protein A3J50_01195 [Candidatus Woykebacteria bacterium RIFCSPHIGHO2_02_FULL_43_16b]OGY29789.1 MAG: hypothetical protein A3F33_02990 [Candidatus Woykebacteria bacterium RIFCSPHIGHO2_12_FULL_43_10]OGY32463.1 MAG: hypothetical protein A3A61_00720 [Candidatus Woykebacteria bacterium RIFCSPLOWO2_01_FULL_43_14]
MASRSVYLVFGSEGSGKTTHAKLLADYLKIPFVSSGSLIRKEIESESVIGKKFAIRSSAYVEDDLVIPFILSVLEDSKYRNGFIIEGFPRDLNQLKSLQEFLARKDLAIKKAIYVTLSESEAIRRLIQRARSDDTPDQIKARLSAYREHKKEMIDELSRSKLLLEIDNSRAKEEVFEELKNKI